MAYRKPVGRKKKDTWVPRICKVYDDRARHTKEVGPYMPYNNGQVLDRDYKIISRKEARRKFGKD